MSLRVLSPFDQFFITNHTPIVAELRTHAIW